MLNTIFIRFLSWLQPCNFVNHCKVKSRGQPVFGHLGPSPSAYYGGDKVSQSSVISADTGRRAWPPYFSLAIVSQLYCWNQLNNFVNSCQWASIKSIYFEEILKFSQSFLTINWKVGVTQKKKLPKRRFCFRHPYEKQDWPLKFFKFLSLASQDIWGQRRPICKKGLRATASNP